MLAKRCFTVVHLLQRGRSPPSLLATLFGCLLMLLLITTIIIWHYQQQNDVDQKGRRRRPAATGEDRVLDCDRLMGAGRDSRYVRWVAGNRITFVDPDNEDDDDNWHREEFKESAGNFCERLRKLVPRRARSPAEGAFPVAVARIVYRDYTLLEAELLAHYQPQNQYCFSVDSKAPERFRWRILRLARCFPVNVHVPEIFREVDSVGHNVDRAHVDCLRVLADPARRLTWRYVFLLQNHDVQIKTNAELVQVLRWLNGTNDVELLPVTEAWKVDLSADWTLGAIGLFRPDSSVLARTAGKLRSTRLQLAKGNTGMALCRAAVDFLLREVDLDALTDRFDRPETTGVDEYLFPSLHAAGVLLGLPGGFTGEGVRKRLRAPFITRFARWVPDAALPGSPANPPEWLCRGPGDRVRHWVCLLGVEDLDGLARMPQLFANKLWPAVDEGAVRCWHAHIRRRTLQQQQEVEEGRRRRPPFPLLQKEVYTELPAVRWKAARRRLLDQAHAQDKVAGGRGGGYERPRGKGNKQIEMMRLPPIDFFYNYTHVAALDAYNCSFWKLC